MQPVQVSKWVVIAGTLLIWLVKWGVRPYWQGGPVTAWLLGIAPNFIGSLLLPFGAYWFFRLFFRFRHLHDLRFVCMFSFVLLVINELLQLIPVFGRTFDWNDIACSAAGLMIAYKIFGRICTRTIWEAGTIRLSPSI